jgi:bifunctional non-homologous end joining protein LigD
MAAPEPMLSTSARSWPAGSDWIMQPKWDGFRILVAVDTAGRIRAWSRHGTSLTASLGDLLDPFTHVAPSSLFDGELVAVASRDGHPVQDFAAVTRAVLSSDAASTPRLRLVAFDLLELAGQDLRQRPWVHRDAQLRDALPATDRVRLVQSTTASAREHDAIVALGFEGTILKPPASTYRPGRQTTWRKYKARHRATTILRSLRPGRDGNTYAVCELDGRPVLALAGASLQPAVGEPVELVYSRVDADGTLREVRVTHPQPSASNSR